MQPNGQGGNYIQYNVTVRFFFLFFFRFLTIILLHFSENKSVSFCSSGINVSCFNDVWISMCFPAGVFSSFSKGADGGEQRVVRAKLFRSFMQMKCKHSGRQTAVLRQCGHKNFKNLCGFTSYNCTLLCIIFKLDFKCSLHTCIVSYFARIFFSSLSVLFCVQHTLLRLCCRLWIICSLCFCMICILRLKHIRSICLSSSSCLTKRYTRLVVYQIN